MYGIIQFITCSSSFSWVSRPPTRSPRSKQSPRHGRFPRRTQSPLHRHLQHQIRLEGHFRRGPFNPTPTTVGTYIQA
jgi:hypothetical protein